MLRKRENFSKKKLIDKKIGLVKKNLSFVKKVLFIG